MDKHYNLNKEEKKYLVKLLRHFIDEDKNVQLTQIFSDIEKELKDKLKALFLEKYEIKGELLDFLNKHFINTGTIFYKSQSSSVPIEYSEISKIKLDYPIDLACISCIDINTYSWELRNDFVNTYYTEIADIYETTFKKYYESISKRYNTFINIYNDTKTIISGYTKATQYLETFGFIDSVNKYLNSIMETVAKNPLTVITQDKLNDYNNYLNQRKKDVK